jgi:hypothetical protein
MDSKARRKYQKALITDGAYEVTTNGKLFFMHDTHYTNYEFTVNARDKFWALRVMLALNYATLALVNHPCEHLSGEAITEYGAAWRGTCEIFRLNLKVEPSQLMLFKAFKGFAHALLGGKMANRLGMASDFAWNLGIDELKVDPPTDQSLFKASVCQMLSGWLQMMAKQIN